MSVPPPFQGEELSAEWNAGYIILSYGIACLGSMVSLELMKQRTSISGRRNWLLLFGGAISLGGIGIWSMHFIGMLALQLRLPSADVLVAHHFAPGWTAFSFFIGIIIVAAGFIIAGDPNHPKIWKNLLAGAAGGIGVSGMHYSGMAAMEGNFTVEWSAGYIICSVAIGIVAATAAMMILFRYGRYWAADLKMQAATSGIMGVAVCGMVRQREQNSKTERPWAEPKK